MAYYDVYDDDWESQDEFSICAEMDELERKAAWEQHIAQEPQPVPETKSPSKRARFLSGLVDRVVDSGQLLLTDTGQAFAYQHKSGCFRPVPNLTAYLANFYHRDTTTSLLVRDVKEIAYRLLWDEKIRCSPDEFNGCPEMVNLGNGVFNTETSVLINHHPRFQFTYQIKADYLTDEWKVKCPVFDAFCRTSLEGDPIKRQLLLEFIGYICLDTNAGKCALFLKGQPNSGKRIITELVSQLFDAELVSNIPLHQLGDRFFRGELAGKKLNVAGEIAGRALRDISIFKSITGNDRIAGEFKGKNPFYFTPRCKLLFSGNTLPLTTESDVTAAFLNRIRVLLFNTSIPYERQDKLLLLKLSAERDAIVTLALRAAQDLAERNFEFVQLEDSKKFLESFALRGNILDAFLDECCVLDPNARAFNAALYGSFEAFCMRNGLDCLSRSKFYDLLSGIPHVTAKRLRIGTENRHGHVGIGLKNSVPPEHWNSSPNALVEKG